MKLNTNSYNGIRIIDSMNLSVPKNRKFLNIIPLFNYILFRNMGYCFFLHYHV